MDLTGIRKAIAANAATADGLEDAKHYDPGVSQASPAFWVVPVRQDRAAFGSSAWSLELIGTLQFLGTWDRSKQEAADLLAQLVWEAIESDKTLGALACSTQVASMTWDTDPATEAVTVEYEIQVEAEDA